MHKVDEEGVKNKSLVESLSRQFHSHSYPVSRKEAMEIGLDVNEKRDPTLEALMWDLWLDLERELRNGSRFHRSLNCSIAPKQRNCLPPSANGGPSKRTCPDVFSGKLSEDITALRSRFSRLITSRSTR